MLWSRDRQLAPKTSSSKDRSKEKVWRFARLQPLIAAPSARPAVGHMTADVHRVDGGEQTAGPAVRAHPLEQAQLFRRSTWREQRVCARSGLTLRGAA